VDSAQGRAVYDTERSMVVAAGQAQGRRGARGKVYSLLESGLADLDEIIAITFTEKAATEMKGGSGQPSSSARQTRRPGRGQRRWRDLSRRLAGKPA